MDNASDLGSGYCGFESRRASDAGSSPVMAKHFELLKHNFYIEGFEAEVVGLLDYLQRSVLNIIVTFCIKIVAKREMSQTEWAILILCLPGSGCLG